ncbi:Carbohydrate esterase family 8 protein [Mycena sanguinolenta]|uniref:pectinesterase n=1 Tax=Mycena sanguinolenta TaxID=230812 RepID=A0A8H6YF53_9AGAR|nr:Carbohydrate esterase family 8 protein [Mycena sanguinolenta]
MQSSSLSFRRVALFFVAYVFAVILGGNASPTGLEKRASRTTPPAGAVVVRQTGATSGEFTTIQAAVNSLPNDGSTQSIFIFPGTYTEKVSITRTGQLTIYGSTTDTTSYTSNAVTITFSDSAAAEGGDDDLSGTLRVHKDDFAMYNVNVKNTFGVGSQALALSAYGTNQGYYGLWLKNMFISIHITDTKTPSSLKLGTSSTVSATSKAQWISSGASTRAFFQSVVIASTAPGCITADGPSDAADDSIFVINESSLIVSTAATSALTAEVYLGRPWTEFARVVYTSTSMAAHINPAGWSIWSTATPNTADVFYAEFDSTGPGAAGTRASFSEKLTSNTGFMAADILGSDWTTWVDQSYV